MVGGGDDIVDGVAAIGVGAAAVTGVGAVVIGAGAVVTGAAAIGAAVTGEVTQAAPHLRDGQVVAKRRLAGRARNRATHGFAWQCRFAGSLEKVIPLRCDKCESRLRLFLACMATKPVGEGS